MATAMPMSATAMNTHRRAGGGPADFGSGLRQHRTGRRGNTRNRGAESSNCPGDRQAAGCPRSGAERCDAVGTGFLQTKPCPVPRQAGADRGLGRSGRHRGFASVRDQSGFIEPQGHRALPRPLCHRDHRPDGGSRMKITREFCPSER
jgi:hypothetical protein